MFSEIAQINAGICEGTSVVYSHCRIVNDVNDLSTGISADPAKSEKSRTPHRRSTALCHRRNRKHLCPSDRNSATTGNKFFKWRPHKKQLAPALHIPKLRSQPFVPCSKTYRKKYLAKGNQRLTLQSKKNAIFVSQFCLSRKINRNETQTVRQKTQTLIFLD